MIKIIKPVFVFTFLSMAIIARAQNNTHSPYSARGFGETEPFNTAFNKSMGGVSNGIRSTRFVSLSNPASLAGLKQVVFDFGFSGISGKISSAKAQQTYYNGNFNYIVLGFPVWQKEVLAKDTSKNKNNPNGKTALIKTYRTIWSSSIGLTPYSSMGSSYSKTVDTSYGSLSNYYARSGGLSNFFLMNAVNVTKNISLGLNAGYIFGQIRSNQIFISNDSGVSRALEDAKTYQLNGFKFDMGIQAQHYDTFTRKIKDSVNGKLATILKKVPLHFIFGATLNNQSALNYNYTRLAFNKSNYFLYNPIDTIVNEEKRGKAYFPMGFSAGFSIKYDNRWLFAFDYASSLLATQKKSLLNEKDQSTNSSQYSIGVAYRPDMDVENMERTRVGRFKPNIEYRIGFRYLNSGYNFKDNAGIVSPVKEYGITFGIGLPMVKRNPYTRETIKSMVNLSGEYIHRGTTKNGMVEEELYKLTIGITLGDIWFTKRKFN